MPDTEPEIPEPSGGGVVGFSRRAYLAVVAASGLGTCFVLDEGREDGDTDGPTETATADRPDRTAYGYGGVPVHPRDEEIVATADDDSTVALPTQPEPDVGVEETDDTGEEGTPTEYEVSIGVRSEEDEPTPTSSTGPQATVRGVRRRTGPSRRPGRSTSE